MSKSPSLSQKIFKETLIYSIGSFGSKILTFLLIPFYTFFLNKKDLGEYDLLITSVSLFVPLVSLQLSDATYRWLLENKDRDNIEKIVTNSIVGYIFSFILFSLCFFVFSIYYPIDHSIYFLTLLFLSGLLPFFQSILRGCGDTKGFAKNGVLTSFLIVLFNLVFVYFFKLKIEGVLISSILAYSISCILLGINLRIMHTIKIQAVEYKYFREMLKYSLPLIPNLMSWWLIGSASKYIILHFLGQDSNGLYAISSRFPSMLVIINTVLILPIQDGILKKDASLGEYTKVLENFFKLEFYLIVCLIVLAPIITKFMVSPDFYESWKYMGFLFIGVGFNTLGALLGMYFQKNLQTYKITYTTLLGAFVSIVLSFFLVKNLGLWGISLSYMFGFLIMFTLRYLYTRNVFKLNFNIYYIFGAFFILFFLNFLVINASYKWQSVISIIVVLIVVFLNIKNIRNLVNMNN